MKNTIVGVDLAKNIIQVCVYTNKKVHSNSSISVECCTNIIFKLIRYLTPCSMLLSS
jgi:hypothetical protein